MDFMQAKNILIEQMRQSGIADISSLQDLKNIDTDINDFNINKRTLNRKDIDVGEEDVKNYAIKSFLESQKIPNPSKKQIDTASIEERKTLIEQKQHRDDLVAKLESYSYRKDRAKNIGNALRSLVGAKTSLEKALEKVDILKEQNKKLSDLKNEKDQKIQETQSSGQEQQDKQTQDKTKQKETLYYTTPLENMSQKQQKKVKSKIENQEKEKAKLKKKKKEGKLNKQEKVTLQNLERKSKKIETRRDDITLFEIKKGLRDAFGSSINNLIDLTSIQKTSLKGFHNETAFSFKLSKPNKLNNKVIVSQRLIQQMTSDSGKDTQKSFREYINENNITLKDSKNTDSVTCDFYKDQFQTAA